MPKDQEPETGDGAMSNISPPRPVQSQPGMTQPYTTPPPTLCQIRLRIRSTVPVSESPPLENKWSTKSLTMNLWTEQFVFLWMLQTFSSCCEHFWLGKSKLRKYSDAIFWSSCLNFYRYLYSNKGRQKYICIFEGDKQLNIRTNKMFKDKVWKVPLDFCGLLSLS